MGEATSNSFKCKKLFKTISFLLLTNRNVFLVLSTKEVGSLRVRDVLKISKMVVSSSGHQVYNLIILI